MYIAIRTSALMAKHFRLLFIFSGKEFKYKIIKCSLEEWFKVTILDSDLSNALYSRCNSTTFPSRHHVDFIP